MNSSNRYSLSEEALNKLLGYLGNRPYVETAALVDLIRNDAKLVANEASEAQEQVSQEQAVS